MENKNNIHYYRLDVYRFIFTIFVVITHFETFCRTIPVWYHLSRGFYRSVDFFFLLSGFLLYKSFCTQHYTNALDFTFAKAKRLMPVNFVVTMITCFFAGFTPVKSFSDMLLLIRNFIHHILSAIPNFIFIQEFIPVFERFCEGDYFVPFWYISIMLLCGFVWFWFLTTTQKKYGSFSKFYGWGLVFPLIILAYIFGEYGQVNISRSFVPGLNVPSGLLRGFADIGLGIFCANFTINIKNKKVLAVIKVIFPLAIFILVFYAAGTAIDFVFIFLCAFVLMFEFSLAETPCKVVRNICRFLEKASIPVYFSHSFVIIFIYIPIVQKWDALADNFPFTLIVRAILIAAASFVLYILSKLMEKPFEKFYSSFKVGSSEPNMEHL